MLKGEVIRGLNLAIDEDFSKNKFSTDSRYLARIKKDLILVYEEPLMSMLPVLTFLIIIGRKWNKTTFKK